MNKIEDLKVGMTVCFKSGSGYMNEGEVASENNDDKVTGFIFYGDPCKIYLHLEDIAIEIDWEKTREVNKDKDMKFTSCQNVDCNKEYDFNDLIDVAVQAQKDKLINHLKIDNVDPWISFEKKCGAISAWDKSCFLKGIDWIKSLYTETFVIENDIDILKLKGEPKITLSNGNEFVAIDMKISSNSRGMHAICFIDIDSYEMVYSFFELKGATVTQKRSL